MKWKGKEQFYKEGISMMALGFFILFIGYLGSYNWGGLIYPNDLLIIMTMSILGSLVLVAGIVLVVISRLIVRES